MDVQEKLSQIVRLVEDARAMPMSASCLVNREELLADLDELRALLPEQLERADVLLSDRDAVVEQGRDAAKRLVDQARAEHDRLVEEQAVVIRARERAAAVVSEANAESTRLLSDADDYVDRKLAEFEIALGKLTQQVVRGRERLGARRAADLGRLADPHPDDDAEPTAPEAAEPPRSASAEPTGPAQSTESGPAPSGDSADSGGSTGAADPAPGRTDEPPAAG